MIPVAWLPRSGQLAAVSLCKQYTPSLNFFKLQAMLEWDDRTPFDSNGVSLHDIDYGGDGPAWAARPNSIEDGSGYAFTFAQAES